MVACRDFFAKASLVVDDLHRLSCIVNEEQVKKTKEWSSTGS